MVEIVYLCLIWLERKPVRLRRSTQICVACFNLFQGIFYNLFCKMQRTPKSCFLYLCHLCFAFSESLFII